jgi:hypothetical protein
MQIIRKLSQWFYKRQARSTDAFNPNASSSKFVTLGSRLSGADNTVPVFSTARTDTSMAGEMFEDVLIRAMGNLSPDGVLSVLQVASKSVGIEESTQVQVQVASVEMSSQN